MSTTATTMRAAALVGYGGYDKLVIRHDWPVPIPSAGQALVKVSACGVNNTDINTRIGWYDERVSTGTANGAATGFDQVAQDSTASWSSTRISFPRIQGADVVGVVVSVGPGVPSDRWIGRRVMVDPWLRDRTDPSNLSKCGVVGSECDGGFAEYVALPVTNLCRSNSTWSDEELATIPCSYITAENMIVRAAVSERDVVLITGASGGVGSALVQLCKRRRATVIALTTAEKAEKIIEIGADAVIRRGEDDWREVICRVTGKQGTASKVTVVADVVGAPIFDFVMDVLARGGRYVTAGAIGGKKVQLDLSKLYLQDWTMMGCTVPDVSVFSNLVGYIERNEIRPLLFSSFTLDSIHKAQEEFVKKKHVGNIVLKISWGSCTDELVRIPTNPS